ncbi:hypothetical protein [Flammeovirga sp. SJP92]|uniref:hypothetical protein n=1 Tax=Flammeovirga sp. SJP92 TaxID=1775430 RepID=UPI000786ED37|nr:hypothetical protein [Flammeovirga sp. SJP92]KXX71785.1 hypothetical protein AVL50_03095 [Flammeovirga sp. SJP92]
MFKKSQVSTTSKSYHYFNSPTDPLHQLEPTNMNRLFIYFILIQSFIFNKAYAQGGLLFKGSSIEKERPTSLKLPKENGINTDSYFELSFDFSLEKGNEIGRILRVITEQEHTIDVIYNPSINGINQSLLIVLDKKNHILSIPLKKYSKYIDWTFFKFIVDQNSQQFTVVLDGNEFKAEYPPLPTFKSLQLEFGASNQQGFEITDIPSFTIQSVKFSSLSDVYEWPLNEYQGNIAREIHHGLDGKVSYPHWILKDHHHWRKITELECGFHPAIMFDSLKQEIVTADQKFLHRYDVRSGNITTTHVPLRAVDNGIFEGLHLPNEKRFLLFDIRGNTVSSLAHGDTLATRKIYNNKVINYWYPNIFYNEHSRQFKEINGYGRFKYKTDYRKYNRYWARWEACELKGDSIAPRYRMGQYKLNSKEYLLYGGVGNENGYQVLGTQFFHDLYKIDTKTDSIHKLWSFDPPIKNMSNAGNIYLDKQGENFYSILLLNRQYNTTIQLAKINIKDGNVETVSDTLVVKYRDTESQIKLFKNSKNNSFYLCHLNGNYDQNKSKLTIYELKGPPISASEMVELSKNKKYTPSNFQYSYIILIVGLVIFFFVISHNFKGSSPSKKEKVEEKVSRHHTEEIPNISTPVQGKNAFLIFGKLELIDRDGNKITDQITEKLRQLFLIVLFYPYTHKRPVSTSELTQLLWPNAPKPKSKNNRSVTVRRLRIILEQCDGIQLVYNNKGWSFEYAPDFYNEFEVFTQLKTQLESDNFESSDCFIAFFHIVAKGNLLRPMAFEYLDDTISNLKTDLINTLLKFAKTKKHIPWIEQITDCIFQYDKLDEDALILKINTLLLMDKKIQAHQEYSKFTKNHLSFFGEAYHKSFEELIK